MMEQSHILIIDDEKKIREVVKSYAEKEGYRVSEAASGQEALQKFAEESFSLVLLDLMLPDLSGEEICRRIRLNSQVPIIMMTAKVDEESIIHGLGIGADDYITKPFSPRQLIARIAATLRRYQEERQNRRLLRRGALVLDTENRQVSKDGQEINLTPNEYRILALLMARPQKIFTRDEIISLVKEDGYEGYDRTIDSHIKNLRQKIEDDPKTPGYIITVYGVGYRLGVH